MSKTTGRFGDGRRVVEKCERIPGSVFYNVEIRYDTSFPPFSEETRREWEKNPRMHRYLKTLDAINEEWRQKKEQRHT